MSHRETDQERRMREYQTERLGKLHELGLEGMGFNGAYVDVSLEDLEFLRMYGDLESTNEQGPDNCYIHRLKTSKGCRFKTITEEEIDFSLPF